MALLVVSKSNGSPLTMVDLRHRRKLTIGRSPRCDLILTATAISRRHALLFEHAGRWALVDTGSSCGVYCSLSDKPVRRITFRPGTWAWIGPSRTAFVEPAKSAQRAGLRWRWISGR